MALAARRAVARLGPARAAHAARGLARAGRRHIQPVALAAVSAVVALAISQVDAPRGRGLGSLLGATGPADRLRAFAVFQLGDCEGRLHALELFDRPDIRRAVALEELLLVGSSGDLRRARGRLTRRDWTAKLRRPSRRNLRGLAVLGHSSTPFLVLIDGTGALRFTTPLPSTPAEYVTFRRTLAALARAAEVGTRRSADGATSSLRR